jgi:hypothetical protein
MNAHMTIITNDAYDTTHALNVLRETMNVVANDASNVTTTNDASNDDTMTITHKLTKSQRARLRRYFATHNVETTKFAKYSTRVISRRAYEYAMS